MTAWSRTPMLLVLLLVAGMSLAACSSDDVADDMSGHVDESDGGRAEAPAPEPEDAVDEPAESTEEDVGLADDADAIVDLPETAAGDRVIKEGTVTIAVEDGAYDRAFGRVLDIAARLGGTVVSSRSATDDDGTAGSVTVRVPVERYEQLLVGVGDLGEVRERDITATDVTAEFTDLESRLRSLEAQQRFYLELLDDADGISDAISVQQQLDTVQEQIEQVKGRLQLLDERTTYSTLTVELFEPGTPVGPSESGTTGERLAGWWQTAQDAFVNVIGALLVVAAIALPMLAPVLLAVAAWRLVRRPATPPS